MSEHTNEFADEEVSSNYTYPKGYNVKAVTDQIEIIRSHLPFLNPDGAIRYMREVHPTLRLSEWTEGFFAIPKWQTMAPTYEAAVENILALIASTRDFHNHREGELGARFLRQHQHSIAMWTKLSDQQADNEILVVPAQFGLRHRGRSVRRARKVFAANEFGLGAFAGGIMLLTHPEREVQWEQLHVDCPGDKFALDADDSSQMPLFRFYDGRVEFDTDWLGSARDLSGSASALVLE